MSQSKDRVWGLVGMIVFSLFLIGWGIYLMVSNKYAKGYDHYTQQATGSGGEYFILFGIIFGIVTYFTLSPFSKFRSFFERRRKK